MAYAYSEDQLIQKSAADLLENELGWQSVYAFDKETLGANGTLGRQSYTEVLLLRELRSALLRLNGWMTDRQVSEAIERLTEHLSTQTPLQINEEKYGYIREGVPVTRQKSNGETETVKARLIDFDQVEQNSFIAVRELKIKGPVYNRRADLIGFVNGLPLLFVELKRNDIDVKNAYLKNYTDYQKSIPQLFYYNAFVMLSNGEQSRVGTLGSKWEFFNEWKRLKEEEAGKIDFPTMLRGICTKTHFLDLLENYILYDHSNGHTAKIMARNHQYLGVNQAVEMYRNREFKHGKLGVFWHTQGSGKSYSMLFLARKIRRKFAGSPTIVILTDREELNRQISDTFENCGMLGNVKASQYIASSGQDLRQKLEGNPSFVFTLIQKFNQPDAAPIRPDHDIIVMSDEAHRSQNGIYADNMARMLPTAHRIGFTGTPLLSSDHITERTFGSYISVYDFKRAVEDHATVPLYYENRGEKLRDLDNPKINEEIAAALEEAELDPTQQEKVEREFAKEIHLLTAEKRLRCLARDFVRHYSDVGASGKAMFVCLNKVTCVRMYNYVQEYWQQEIDEMKKHVQQLQSQQAFQEIQRKVKWMEETEMAVVVSQEQNEMQTFQKWGLDILPHREKMEKRDLDKDYKNAAHPLRIVFVCAMWLTGFDVKTLSCLYLDKPMKAHTLMQAIARANRVAEGKENGLIIDYIGIVKALRQALADYTAHAGQGQGNDPTVDKAELIRKICEIENAATALLAEHGFDLAKLIDSTGFDKVELLKDAADALCTSLEARKRYSTLVSTLQNLWKYLNQEEKEQRMREQYDALTAIYRKLHQQRAQADITELSVKINGIVNDYLQLPANIAHEGRSVYGKRFDISQIDFVRLSNEFARVKHQHLLLKDLEELVQQRLAEMMTVNAKRIDFYERYQAIIENYNAEQNRATIERTFDELMKLSQELGEEEQRYVREGFENDEQLAIYDLLYAQNLSKADIKKLKEVSVELLAKIKDQLQQMDHPFDKPETRAAVDVMIRDFLWYNLPECYTDTAISQYRHTIFDYAQQHYAGR